MQLLDFIPGGKSAANKILEQGAPQVKESISKMLDSVIVAEGERACLLSFKDDANIFISLVVMNGNMAVVQNLHTAQIETLISFDGIGKIMKKLAEEGKIKVD